jgi:hypothetical protein
MLFMATPLLRSTRGFQQGGNFVLRGNGQSIIQGNGSQGQILPGQGGSNLTNRRFVMGGSFLGGLTGPIIYFIALLVSLAAALGMLFIKRWGQVLGITMAVLYGLLGLVSMLPILLMSSLGMRNPFSLILSIAHVLLAAAVIVLASIPAKKAAIPAMANLPPAAST